MTLGERLRREIERYGMSIREFQKQMYTREVRGSSYASINAYLKDERDPPAEFIRAAADLLGVRGAWLLSEEGERTPELQQVQGPVVFSIDRAERRLRELFPGFQGLPEGTRPVFREVVNRYVQFCMQESGALPTPEIVSENTQRLGRALMGPFENLGVYPERLSRGQFFTYVLAQLNAIALAIPPD